MLQTHSFKTECTPFPQSLAVLLQLCPSLSWVRVTAVACYFGLVIHFRMARSQLTVT